MKNLRNMRLAVILWLLFFASPSISNGQERTSTYEKVYSLPDKFFGGINKKSEKFQHDLIKSTEQYLKKLSKQELKLQRRLAKKDSAVARQLFGDVNKRYDSLRNVLYSTNGKAQNIYSGHLDSMQTALQFFNKNKVLGQSPEVQAKLQSVFKDYGNVQGKLNQTKLIQEQLKQRQQMLRQKLQNFGLVKEFRKYQEKVYYYRAQVDEYKTMFETPGKLEATLLKVANKIPAFSNFFNKHSQLAGLFQLPGKDDVSSEALNGLQTRSLLDQEMGRLGAGNNQQAFVSQNIGNAQSTLSGLKNRLGMSGSAGNADVMPDFKPENQKTKSFLKRLELGTNVQSTKSGTFLPSTTDFGLSIGYKLNTRSVLGVGASYRMGWGKDIRHIAISHEGVGLRTFFDIKLKGTIWFSGGGEMNYRAKFTQIEELQKYDAWQQSLLAGISKKYQVSKKLKGNVQLLYDFLHYRNVPRTQPIIFRVGYQLK